MDEQTKRRAGYHRNQCLQEAAELVNTTNHPHGDLEDSFDSIAGLWSAYLGMDITPVNVSVMMILLKTGRLMCNEGMLDSWIDIAGYAACGFELVENSYTEND